MRQRREDPRGLWATSLGKWVSSRLRMRPSPKLRWRPERKTLLLSSGTQMCSLHISSQKQPCLLMPKVPLPPNTVTKKFPEQY